jgi:hypothetical protein
MTENLPDQARFVFLLIYIPTLIVLSFWPDLNQMKKNIFILLALCLLIFSSWYFWRGIIGYSIPTWKTEDLGDKYGSLTSLFTGLAFAGLLFTIYLQQGQINDAEKEQRLRRFENTFFQLQNSLDRIITSTELTALPTSKKGQVAFAELNKKFRMDFLLRDNPLPYVVTIDQVKNKYGLFYGNYSPQLGHYFRVLYHIYKLIDSAKIDKEDKDFYARLIRAQLSSDELALLFYNCFRDEGENFKKKYVERYAILKHLKKDEIGNDEILGYFKGSAYSDCELLPNEK